MSESGKMKVVLFGGTFGPPTMSHYRVIQFLVANFDEVVVIPCGSARMEKTTVRDTMDVDRIAMLQLVVARFANVTLDLYDLANGCFTCTEDLDFRYKSLGYEVWHYVGADLVKYGEFAWSEIQRNWRNGLRIWNTLNFVVGTRVGYRISLLDLPKHHRLVELCHHDSSTKVKRCVKEGKPYDQMVLPAVASYIAKHGLYRPNEPAPE